MPSRRAPVLPYPGSQEDTGAQGPLPTRSEPRGLHSAEATGPAVSLRSPALQGEGLVPLSPAAKAEAKAWNQSSNGKLFPSLALLFQQL